MRVLVAGSTGAVGQSLLPLLIRNGHEVTALVHTPARATSVQALGARAAVADALDKAALTAAIRSAAPEVILHQATALAGLSGSFRRFDREFALTNRLRTEATETMLIAARQAGTRRLVVQSFCGWPFAREGGAVKTEADPLDPDPPASFRQTLAAIRYQEELVRRATGIEAIALRFGVLYGPGSGIARDGPIAALVRRRQLPIVGDGAGVWSFLHVEDAAGATAAAMTDGAPGIYNVVDDEPAPVASWLPLLSATLGAGPPRHVPTWLARLLIGEGGVAMMTRNRGGANEKAKRELGWRLRYPSWRRGFAEGLG